MKIACEHNLAIKGMCMQLYVHTIFFIMGVSNLSGVNGKVYYLTSVSIIKQMSVYAICQNCL